MKSPCRVWYSSQVDRVLLAGSTVRRLRPTKQSPLFEVFHDHRIISWVSIGTAGGLKQSLSASLSQGLPPFLLVTGALKFCQILANLDDCIDWRFVQF